MESIIDRPDTADPKLDVITVSLREPLQDINKTLSPFSSEGSNPLNQLRFAAQVLIIAGVSRGLPDEPARARESLQLALAEPYARTRQDSIPVIGTGINTLLAKALSERPPEPNNDEQAKWRLKNKWMPEVYVVTTGALLLALADTAEEGFLDPRNVKPQLTSTGTIQHHTEKTGRKQFLSVIAEQAGDTAALTVQAKHRKSINSIRIGTVPYPPETRSRSDLAVIGELITDGEVQQAVDLPSLIQEADRRIRAVAPADTKQ